MTNQEILTKAIEKAIENGWDARELGGVDVWEELSELERLHVVKLVVGTKDTPNGFMIIFTHDFAKALWGEEPETVWDIISGHGAAFQDSVENWEYHLQQMVIGEDPIKYLGDNL